METFYVLEGHPKVRLNMTEQEYRLASHTYTYAYLKGGGGKVNIYSNNKFSVTAVWFILFET